MNTFFSEGGFILSTANPSSNCDLPGSSMSNYNEELSGSIYDIPAYDTESSLVILYNLGYKTFKFNY